MKRLLLLAAVYLILCPTILWANVTTSKNVTITWTMSNTTNVIGYKVYYADNSAMANKILHSDCSDPIENPTNTFTITCNNINLTEGTTYYFTVVAQINDASESASNPKGVPYIKPILVHDFKIVIPRENIAPTAVISANPTSGAAPLTVSFDGSSSTDSDGTVVAYSWDFGDGSPIDTSATTNHTFSTVGSFQVSLVVTDDQGKVSEPATINIAANKPGATPDYTINFQPATAPIPAGYSADSGEVFSESRGYGWFGGTNSGQTRDANNPDSQNQAYDTHINVNEYGKWEFTIPNGTYSVKIVIGDADWPDGISYIQAEGIAIVSGETLTPRNRWIKREGTVNITDGRLTLTFTGSTTSKLCFLEITKQ